MISTCFRIRRSLWAAVCFAIITPASAALDCARAGDADHVIDARMMLALDVVRANNLQAPEAARLYALTAQTLERAFEGAAPNASKAGASAVMAQAALTLLIKEYPQIGPHLNKFGKYGPCPGTAKSDVRRGQKLGQKISKRAPRPARKTPGAPQAEIGPILIDWANGEPMALKSSSQFRPPGPPALNSGEFSIALETVKSLGRRGSRARTTDQSAMARFWAGGDYTSSGPGQWNIIALQVSQNRPVKERLKLLTLMNVAMSDAGLAAWDAKYHFRYWRPDVAITQIDPDWIAFLETPRHPEYISAHSALSAAAATVLTRQLGPQKFCTTSEGLKGAERCYEDFYAAAGEAGISRIYGGIHFPFSNEDGLKLGRDVAEFILTGNTRTAR